MKSVAFFRETALDEVLSAIDRAITWIELFVVEVAHGVLGESTASSSSAASGEVTLHGMTLDDADIRGALNGDETAYRRLIERHQQAVGDYLWKFTRNRTDWDELLQTVFVEAYLSLKGFKRKGTFVDWVRGIATHVGYRFWTQQKQRRGRTISMEDSAALQVAGPTTRSLGLFELLEHLPPRDRLVLTLMYVEQQSVAETAELTGWSESLVKVQAHRARQKLKVLWDQHHVE